MTTESDFVDRVYDAADGQPDEAKWAVAVAMLAGVLLRSHPFTRESKLRGIQNELREAIAIIPQIQKTASPKETT